MQWHANFALSWHLPKSGCVRRIDNTGCVWYVILWYTVYTKTYRLMAKRKWCFPVYDYARARTYCAGTRNNLVYVRISIRVLRPTQDRMNFSRFRRLVSRSASSGSVPYHCYTLPLWYRHWGYLVFRSGISVTDLPWIQSSIQPEKIKKWTSELNCHKESTQDKESVAIT